MMKTDCINVLFLSHWFRNPYKSSLIESLSLKNVKVEDAYSNLVFLAKTIRHGNNIDILHTHDLHKYCSGRHQLLRLIKFSLFAGQLLVLKIRGIKLIWTVHEWTDRFRGGKDDIPSSYCKILGKLFDAIIVHCPSNKKEIEEAFFGTNTKKVFVVPHGNYIGSYENKIDRRDARQILGIPDEEIVFLLFGHLYRTKGFLEAIDAFQALNQEQTYLLIAGDPTEEGIEQQIEDKIEGNKNILFFPGRVPNEEIQVYMNACDCVLLPYKIFTTSGVTILAMSFGKACIAPDLGFFRDILDEEGNFLYQANKDEGLLQAMKNAVDKKKELPKMGEHNFKLAKQWDWKNLSEQISSIYKVCLNRR